jgi:hypothetical protein
MYNLGRGITLPGQCMPCLCLAESKAKASTFFMKEASTCFFHKLPWQLAFTAMFSIATALVK